ncbi:MAG TPA: hemerythrin domain-containing protein [Syntrophorhabdaceae bacterium]|jgi:hemerythrin-like domain-containing protein
MKATEQLRNEHEGVKVMLGILGKMGHQLETTGNVGKDHFEKVLEFLKVFVDKCHHGKEEDLLFPALEAAGVPKDGPIAVMLYEHEMGRSYVRAMSEAFSLYISGNKSSSEGIVRNSREYIVLLNAHIEKENNVLFVMADDLLPEEEQDRLLEGFEKIEEERIGVGKHEEFHRLIKNLSGIYLG